MRYSVFKKISLFVLFVSAFTVTISVQHLANAQTAESAKPTLFVYSEQQTIRELDSVKVKIHLSNNADYPLTEVNISVIQPDFLTLQCQEKSADCSKLGSIQAYSTTSRSLAIMSKSTVTPGDYKIAFVVRYKWKTKGSRGQSINKQSFVVAEQPLSVKFFGSDSIAGVPLGIATLIVPGLSCLLVLAWMGVPWSREWPLGEKMLYSVLVSIAILTIGGKFLQLMGDKFLQLNLTPARAISTDILATSSVLGAVIGFLLGIVYWIGCRGWLLWQQYQAQKEQELQISPSDDIYTLLEKMLRLNKKNIKSCPKTLIILKDGKQYVGSLAAKQGEQYWLIGWFKILPPEISQERTENIDHIMNNINRCLNEEKLIDALQLARRHKFQIIIRESIYLINDDSPEISTNWEWKQWSQSEVGELSLSAEAADFPLLKLCPNNTSSSRRTAGT